MIRYPAAHAFKRLRTLSRVQSFLSHRTYSIQSEVTAGNAERLPADAKVRSPAPLSALPFATLCRSLLINAISSKPFLLDLSLPILNSVSKANNKFFLSVKWNKPLAWLLKQTVYKQFCAGEEANEVKSTLRTLQSLGFRGTILTYGREIVSHDGNPGSYQDGSWLSRDADRCPHIQAWHQGILETVNMLGEGDQLAIKMTGAGPSAIDILSTGKIAPPQMLQALYDIIEHCKRVGARVLIDAESQKYQAGIFETGMHLMQIYNKGGHAIIYNTYQGYLKSTPATLSRHLAMASGEGFTLGLKLVRGAYLDTEPRNLIHNTKQETDDAYDYIAQGALRRELYGFGNHGGRVFPSLNLLLAGHNRKSMYQAFALHRELCREGKPTVPLAMAQLHGMADSVSFGLLGLGGNKGEASHPEIYKCSTWGPLKECMGYLSRRACENRDAAGRTVEEYKALQQEVWRRVRHRLF